MLIVVQIVKATTSWLRLLSGHPDRGGVLNSVLIEVVS